MFSNLSKGSIFYGADQSKNMQIFTAFVEEVTPPYMRYHKNRVPEMVVDIKAMVNGELKEFKQVPSNTTIADFGEDSFILGDSREALISYLQVMLQNSINIVNSAERHKPKIPNYKKAIGELNPTSVSNEESINEVKALREEVGSLKSQLAETIALLKKGTINQTE